MGGKNQEKVTVRKACIDRLPRIAIGQGDLTTWKMAVFRVLRDRWIRYNGAQSVVRAVL